MMDHILRDCKGFAEAYLDDVVIYSASWEQHIVHLQEVFARLRQAGLTLKVEKCKFARESTPYLGHVVGSGEVRPDPAKMQAVNDCKVPETKKDVRAFLGRVGYYRRFIPEFSTIAAPLTDLTRKRKPNNIEWTKDCAEAFQKLKKTLLSSSVLKVADSSRQFILQTDASDRGLGAVLSQKNDQGVEHPVAYASRKLLPREVNYATIEKECLAIVWALRFFHIYLYGQQFLSRIFISFNHLMPTVILV